VLLAAPSLTVIAIIGLLAWQFTSRALAIGTVLALLLVSMLGIWPEAMTRCRWC
jgi:glycine betaine/proline transport system permease protein